MGVRHSGRVVAFQIIFSFEFNGNDLSSLVDFEIFANTRKKISPEAAQYGKQLIAGVMEYIETIDSIIKKTVKNWSFSRISKVELAILRLGVYSIMYLIDVPFAVTINEMITISKEFGADDSYKFVNGVLDRVRLKREESEQ